MSGGVSKNGLDSLDTKRLIDAHALITEAITELREEIAEVKEVLIEQRDLLVEIKEVLQGN